MGFKLKKIFRTKSFKVFINGLWKDNPIFGMILGICSSLAITNKVENAIAMGVGVTFVLIATSVMISLMRKFIPSGVRMITYMVVIATFVIVVDQYLKAFFPIISEAIGPYVGLIITNCILMGRAEAFAIKNGVGYSILDAIGCGLGYSLALLSMSIIREVLAFGTILNIRVVSSGWTNWVVMSMAPGAFFLLSIILWVTRTLAKIEPPREG